MAGILVDGGETAMLELIVNKQVTTENLVLRLYQNDHTPADSDTTAQYTEATFTGYAGITTTGASWVTSGTTPTQVAYPQQTFSSTADQAAQTIYGAYTTRVTTGDLVHAERFPNPTTIQSNGDAVNVTATLTQS